MINNIHRNMTKSQLYYILNEASYTNLIETITECFYIRDHRKGKGERKIGRLCFNWIADMHPMIFLRIMRYIPEFGRWDDLLYITNEFVQPFIYKYISNQIHHDILQMTIGCPISTCAKWMPSEGKTFARHYSNQFHALIRQLGMTLKEYRIKLSTLRRYLNIPEHYLCKGSHIKLRERQLTHGARKLYQKALFLPLKNKKQFNIPIKQENNYILIAKQIEV